MLSHRGYELIGFENVLGLPLDLAQLQDVEAGPITVDHAGPDETAAWMDAVATGFLHPDTFDGPASHESYNREAIEQIFGDTFATPSFERFIARRDGAVAGGASLRIYEGVAQLAGAATLPDHRRQGVTDGDAAPSAGRGSASRLRRRGRHDAAGIEVDGKRTALRIRGAVRAGDPL